MSEHVDTNHVKNLLAYEAGYKEGLKDALNTEEFKQLLMYASPLPPSLREYFKQEKND